MERFISSTLDEMLDARFGGLLAGLVLPGVVCFRK